MKRIPIILLMLAVLAGFAHAAFAAPADPYYPIMKGDEDMRSLQSRKDMISSGFQYGAWITPVIIYQDTPGSELVTSITTFRAWMKTYLWQDSFLYVRGKDTYTAVIYDKNASAEEKKKKKRNSLLYLLAGDPSSAAITYLGTSRAKDKNVIDLDLGYIDMATPRKEFTASIGRKYFLIGNGMVMNGRGDGVELGVNTKYINIKALGAWTGWLAKDDNPYGLSDRDITTGAKRVFAGGTLSTSWFNQTLYAFGLAQFDFGKEQYNYNNFLFFLAGGNADGAQYYNTRTRYESQYYGAGLEGVITSGLTYSGEFIAETGKSYTYDPLMSNIRSKKDIMAFAGMAKIEYYLNVLLKPVFTAEYAFGSGDPNRDDYRLPTGNRFGKDSGFIYFGTFVGGDGLKPSLGNLHVISASAAVSPLSWSKIYSVKNMTLIARYLYYMKHRAEAAINNGLDATKFEREVGHGLDASLRWQIFSDFSFFTNYGLFIPGDAFGYSIKWQYTLSPASITPSPSFSSRAYRHFVMAGFNISF